MRFPVKSKLEENNVILVTGMKFVGVPSMENPAPTIAERRVVGQMCLVVMLLSGGRVVLQTLDQATRANVRLDSLTYEVMR